jgi:hypothetical protein
MSLFKKKKKNPQKQQPPVDQKKILSEEEIQNICLTVIRENERSPYRKRLKMIMEYIPKA